MPATDMVAAVGAIVPDGVTVTSPGRLTADTPEGGPAKGWIDPTLEGPAGPGRLNVMLFTTPELSNNSESGTEQLDNRAQAGGGQIDFLSCPDASPLTGTTHCTQLRDDRDAVIGRRLTNRSGDLVMFEVALLRGDGIVFGAVANTVDDKWDESSPTSADRPPLTLDQLEDLVRNDAWVMPAT